MLKKILNIGLGLAFALASSTSFGQGASCLEMEPICTDVGISFIAGVDGEAEAGNDYGCLGTWPSPSWYYLEIAVGGDIEMELFAGSDIDFIIWGPFDDLDAAKSNCGTLGGVDSPIVDCSYSGVAYETPEITSCLPGEVYILLITNFAGIVQEVTLGKIGGDAETNCDIVVIPPCVSEPGTFTLKKNGVFTGTDDPIYLCQGDSFEIISNEDYTLPNDTIPAPIGDGIYTAQLMWLIYDAPPVGGDPVADPGYLGMIIPTDDIIDTHDADSPIGGLGCGTYYFVPVAGDDGVGDGGDNDNSSVTWDKNGNGCYTLGDAIVVTYSCAIEADMQVNCGGDYINGMDFNLSGGNGDFTVINFGDGDLVSGDVAHDGTAVVENLENGSHYEITVTDEAGCSFTFEGTFSAPVINPIVITPAITCPDASVGNVDATIIDGSGNGGPYTIIMNGTPTPGTNADLDDIAGTSVTIIAVDQEGCISDSVITITSSGHFIDVDIISITNITCFGLNNGSAEISANPVDADGLDEGEVVTITWTSPGGTPFTGDETNTTKDDMEPGTWYVTITDDVGCEVTIPVEITSPSELDIFVDVFNEPTCYGLSDGSINLSVTGGTLDYIFSWKDYPDNHTDVLNTIGAGSYWGYVTDENGCIDSVLVVVDQPDSLWAEFTVKNVLCYGESTGAIVVDEVHNASGPIHYFWNLGGIVPNPATDDNLADGLPVGTYTITIQDEFCDNTYEFTITQNPIIEITIDSDPAYCRLFGYQSGSGVIEGFATGGVPSHTYEWKNLETEDTHDNTTWGGLNPGTYEITVTDAVGCIMTQTVELDSVNPQAIFTVDSDQLNGDLKGTEDVFAHFSNQSLYFFNPNNPSASTLFRWNFDDGAGWIISEDVDDQYDRVYDGEEVYTVCLIAYNKNGCADTLCKDITVFAQPDFVPYNIFSPDQDGINDLFTFEKDADGIETFNCIVVDRWGNQVFEFTDINQSWNGENKNGNPCSDGVFFYTYVIEYTNATKQEGQGTITLIRSK